MRKTIILFMLLFNSLCISLTAQEMVSEKILVIRTDDFGMCHTVNTAIKQVIESGIPISTSVMFACPWYQEAVDILKNHPEVAVGVHLTLNAEWKNYRWGPVSGQEAVPSLVDSAGYFFPSRAKLFGNDPDTDEIEKELRAQLNRAVNSGIRIDYLDYHMGTAVDTPELRAMVESLAKEYKLGMSGYFGENYSGITYGAPITEKSDSLLQHIRNLNPGINLQVFHLGTDTPEMQALIDQNEFGLPEMSKHRQAELKALLNPELRSLIKAKKITLLTYKNLIDEIGLENMYRSEGGY